MTEAEVRKTGGAALVGQRPMTKVGRAVEKGESQGFMKIMVDAQSKLILGAAILGTGGDEAIHSILDIMYAKAPYTTIQRAVHIHPTVSELIPTMLGELRPLAGACGWEGYADIRFSISDWRDSRPARADTAGRGQLGGPLGLAASGE